jgi:hypothetical protein
MRKVSPESFRDCAAFHKEHFGEQGHYCSSLNYIFLKLVQFQKVIISKSHITNFETLPRQPVDRLSFYLIIKKSYSFSAGYVIIS